MKLKSLCIASLICCWGCYEDKGTYDYQEVAEITIENIPESVEILGGAEYIVATPKITSSLEGEITDENPNFTFLYRIELKSGGTIQSNGQKWVVLDSTSKDLNILASFPANTYLCWFSVKDIRTGRETSTSFDVKITSPTYEGWMVLCNEGEENRVRMDMISVISKDRIIPAYDLLSGLGLPECKDAKMLGWYPNLYASPGDLIYCMTKDGTYKLNNETFKTDISWDIKNIDFIIPPTNENTISYATLNSGGFPGSLANFCVTDAGNAYVQVLGLAGAAFETPINTSIRGTEPEYQVSPFIGVSMERPGNGKSALFYDIDNKRFVGWAYGANEDARQILTPLSDPENKLFSFKTGMTLIEMESTRYSGGLVYSVLEDTDKKRFVYGINMKGTDFKQESMYEIKNAPDFNQATQFAFHSQFPFMFYAVDNKVYLYNLGTNNVKEVLKLADGENITLLKFNLYQQSQLTLLNNQSEEFMALQFELMVGSYNNKDNKNGGKLGFYKIDGTTNSMHKRIEYGGFAKIIDVVYRERR